MAETKKNILTYAGLKKYEDELAELKVVKRKEVAQKIKEAREQGDLSENAEYDAAKDEQRDIELRIEELEKLLNNLLPKKALHEYGVTEAELEEFTDSVLENQGRLMANNFVKLDRDRVLKIYREVF